MPDLDRESLLTEATNDLVQHSMDLSRELRFRWHEGLHKFCLFLLETFMKTNHVVAWKDDKLYFRLNKVKTRMVLDVLYAGIENLEKDYPMSIYAYVYDAESDELLSFNALKDGSQERTAVAFIEKATPMEDRPVFQALSEHLGNVDCQEFMSKLEQAFSQTLPQRSSWPFESRDALPTLKAWPSRQEGPPDLQLILDKGQEGHKLSQRFKNKDKDKDKDKDDE